MISMKASGFTYNPAHNHANEDGTMDYNFDKIKVTDCFNDHNISSLINRQVLLDN